VFGLVFGLDKISVVMATVLETETFAIFMLNITHCNREITLMCTQDYKTLYKFAEQKLH